MATAYRKKRTRPTCRACRKKPGEKKRQNFAALKSRLRASARGRRVLSISRRFWKLKDPVEITTLRLPRRFKRDLPVAFLGRAPAITVADGPKHSFRKKRILRLPSGAALLGGADGRKMAIVNTRRGIPEKPRLRLLGYAAQTDYLPTPEIRKAGSPKGKNHWQHKHSDEGGTWPRVYADQNGNVYYGKSTVTFNGLWMRR